MQLFKASDCVALTGIERADGQLSSVRSKHLQIRSVRIAQANRDGPRTPALSLGRHSVSSVTQNMDRSGLWSR